MSVAERMRLNASLWDHARALKEATLRAMHPDWLVTGSVTSSSYGEPRFTHHIDLIVAMPATRIAGLAAAFPLSEFYCPPEEVLRAEIARGQDGQFNLVHHATGFKADIYIAGSDELSSWAFDHVRRIEAVSGRFLRLAPPEYVILGKLQFFSEGGGERHIRDIRAMLEVDPGAIDHDFLHAWIKKLDLSAAWEVVQGH